MLDTWPKKAVLRSHSCLGSKPLAHLGNPIAGRRISKCNDPDAEVCDGGEIAGNEFGEAGQGYISWTLVFLSILDFILSVLGSLWRVLKSTII